MPSAIRGMLKTTSPTTFEAAFTVDGSEYKYTGTARMDMKTPFKNTIVKVIWCGDTSDLAGKPEFDAIVTDTHDIIIGLGSESGILVFGNLEVDIWGPPVLKSVGLLPIEKFDGTGSWING